MNQLFTAVIMLVAIAFGGSAVAQSICSTHASMRMNLDMRYGETRRGVGMAGQASAFEIWASDEKPYTWTILKVYPSGQACIAASGEGWRTDPPVVPGAPV